MHIGGERYPIDWETGTGGERRQKRKENEFTIKKEEKKGQGGG
jgi:hypothetical protein